MCTLLYWMVCSRERWGYIIPSMIVLLVGGRSLPPSRLLCSPLLRWFGGGKGRRRMPARLQGK